MLHQVDISTVQRRLIKNDLSDRMAAQKSLYHKGSFTCPDASVSDYINLQRDSLILLCVFVYTYYFYEALIIGNYHLSTLKKTMRVSVDLLLFKVKNTFDSLLYVINSWV